MLPQVVIEEIWITSGYFRADLPPRRTWPLPSANDRCSLSAPPLEILLWFIVGLLAILLALRPPPRPDPSMDLCPFNVCPSGYRLESLVEIARNGTGIADFRSWKPGQISASRFVTARTGWTSRACPADDGSQGDHRLRLEERAHGLSLLGHESFLSLLFPLFDADRLLISSDQISSLTNTHVFSSARTALFASLSSFRRRDAPSCTT